MYVNIYIYFRFVFVVIGNMDLIRIIDNY